MSTHSLNTDMQIKNVNFIPDGIVAGVKNRIDVKDSHEKITGIFKSASVFEQEVILQDLLIAGKSLKTFEERELVLLAINLFESSSEQTKGDFLFHLANAREICHIFLAAMKSAYMMKKIIASNIPIRKSPELLEYFTNLRGR